MKQDIHPQYYPSSIVTCTSCGKTFNTGSTKQSITVEVCYLCHPFYTGEHKFLDVRGRVDSFQKKQQIAQKYKSTLSQKKQKKVHKDEDREPKSLRELLGEI